MYCDDHSGTVGVDGNRFIVVRRGSEAHRQNYAVNISDRVGKKYTETALFRHWRDNFIKSFDDFHCINIYHYHLCIKP